MKLGLILNYLFLLEEFLFKYEWNVVVTIKLTCFRYLSLLLNDFVHKYQGTILIMENIKYLEPFVIEAVNFVPILFKQYFIFTRFSIAYRSG